MISFFVIVCFYRLFFLLAHLFLLLSVSQVVLFTERTSVDVQAYPHELTLQVDQRGDSPSHVGIADLKSMKIRLENSVSCCLDHGGNKSWTHNLQFIRTIDGSFEFVTYQGYKIVKFFAGRGV